MKNSGVTEKPFENAVEEETKQEEGDAEVLNGRIMNLRAFCYRRPNPDIDNSIFGQLLGVGGNEKLEVSSDNEGVVQEELLGLLAEKGNLKEDRYTTLVKCLVLISAGVYSKEQKENRENLIELFFTILIDNRIFNHSNCNLKMYGEALKFYIERYSDSLDMHDHKKELKVKKMRAVLADMIAKKVIEAASEDFNLFKLICDRLRAVKIDKCYEPYPLCEKLYGKLTKSFIRKLLSSDEGVKAVVELIKLLHAHTGPENAKKLKWFMQIANPKVGRKYGEKLLLALLNDQEYISIMVNQPGSLEYCLLVLDTLRSIKPDFAETLASRIVESTDSDKLIVQIVGECQNLANSPLGVPPVYDGKRGLWPRSSYRFVTYSDRFYDEIDRFDDESPFIPQKIGIQEAFFMRLENILSKIVDDGDQIVNPVTFPVKRFGKIIEYVERLLFKIFDTPQIMASICFHPRLFTNFFYMVHALAEHYRFFGSKDDYMNLFLREKNLKSIQKSIVGIFGFRLFSKCADCTSDKEYAVEVENVFATQWIRELGKMSSTKKDMFFFGCDINEENFTRVFDANSALSSKQLDKKKEFGSLRRVFRCRYEPVVSSLFAGRFKTVVSCLGPEVVIVPCLTSYNKINIKTLGSKEKLIWFEKTGAFALYLPEGSKLHPPGRKVHIAQIVFAADSASKDVYFDMKGRVSYVCDDDKTLELYSEGSYNSYTQDYFKHEVFKWGKSLTNILFDSKTKSPHQGVVTLLSVITVYTLTQPGCRKDETFRLKSDHINRFFAMLPDSKSFCAKFLTPKSPRQERVEYLASRYHMLTIDNQHGLFHVPLTSAKNDEDESNEGNNLITEVSSNFS